MDFLCNGTINKDTFSMRCSKTSNYWRLSSLVTQGTEMNTLLTSICSLLDFGYILNAISNAPHILLMAAEVNESQFPKFSFQLIWHWSNNNTFKRKLFCRIPVVYNALGPE